jgi:hypothetical protein
MTEAEMAERMDALLLEVTGAQEEIKEAVQMLRKLFPELAERPALRLVGADDA